MEAVNCSLRARRCRCSSHVALQTTALINKRVTNKRSERRVSRAAPVASPLELEGLIGQFDGSKSDRVNEFPMISRGLFLVVDSASEELFSHTATQTQGGIEW